MTTKMFRRPNTLISDSGLSNCSTCYVLRANGDYLETQKRVRKRELLGDWGNVFAVVGGSLQTKTHNK